MKRYIKANAMQDSVSNLQNKSNELVDSILQLIDKYPAMEAYVKRMDAIDNGYGDPEEYANEFKGDISNVIDDINYAIKGINRIIEYYDK
jgi:uncharacterized UPF0160 family protein